MTKQVKNCRNKRMQVVRAYEMEKISKNRYTAEYNLTCQFNNMNRDNPKDVDGKREHERTNMAKCTSEQTT